MVSAPAMDISLLLLLVIVALLAHVQAGLVKRAPARLPENIGVLANKFIVEFDKPPTRTENGSSLSQLVQQHDRFRRAARDSGVRMQEQKSFTHLFNGLSVTFDSDSDHELEKVAALPGVKHIFSHLTFRREPQPLVLADHDLVQPTLRYSHNMTSVNRVVQELGASGRNIKVGVIDSGIDYLHPAFSEQSRSCKVFGGAGCRVKYGVDYVGDHYDASNINSVPVPDKDPLDCGGHGTHVAGIIGGADTEITGVAPLVTFGAYRVFGCSGSTSSEIIMEAMEQAERDNMDIINLSLSGGAVFADYPHAVVASRLAELGLLVVASNGNSGREGLFRGGSPGIARSGFGIGSFDNIMVRSTSITVKNVPDLESSPFAVDDSTVAFPDSIDKLVTSSPTPDNPKDACEPFGDQRFAGAVVLIRRGECTFAIKAKNAADAGASGIIFYNNVPGFLSASLRIENFKMPAGYIPINTGIALVKAISEGKNPQISFIGKQIDLPNTTGGFPSDFSSYGPGPQLEIKPDLSAPGGLIYSSFPRAKGSYATLSGTSMSSPYFAGVLALYLEQNPSYKRDRQFSYFQSLAQTTADPAIIPGSNLAFSVAKQGAGLVDAYSLLMSRASISPSKLELHDTAHRTYLKTRTIVLTNEGDNDVMYITSHQPAITINGKFQATPIMNNATATVSFTKRVVTVPAGGSVRLMITVDVGQTTLLDVDHWLFSGYAVFTPEVISASYGILRIPYLVMKGDYGSYPIITPSELDPTYPFLSDVTVTSEIIDELPLNTTSPRYQFPNQTAIYDLIGSNKPVVVVKTIHPIRLLAINVYENGTDRLLGYLAREEQAPPFLGVFPSYIRSNPLGINTKKYGWDGTVFSDPELKNSTTVPLVGAYYFRLSATMPSLNLDGFQGSTVDIWRSPVIVLRGYDKVVPATSTKIVPMAKATTGPKPKRRSKSKYTRYGHPTSVLDTLSY